MAKPRAFFPFSLWDGDTINPDRIDFQTLVDPDAFDFDRQVVEMLAVQSHLFDALSFVEVSSGTALPVTYKETVYKLDASGGSFILTLPDPTIQKQKLNFKKIDASGLTITVRQFDSETIDGDAEKIISSQWTNLTIISDGANWLIL